MEASKWLLRLVQPVLKKAFDSITPEELEGYTLMLVGHSLGGAVASLAAMILQDELQALFGNKIKVQAVGFETPPVMSEELLEVVKSKYNVTNVVFGFDIIPFSSLKNLAELRRRVDEVKLTEEIAAVYKG